jgi:hypothetical protein
MSGSPCIGTLTSQPYGTFLIQSTDETPRVLLFFVQGSDVSRALATWRLMGPIARAVKTNHFSNMYFSFGF